MPTDWTMCVINHRETLSKGKLKLVTSSSSRRADWAPRIAHPGDARDTGSAGTRGAAELGRASTAASSLSLFTTADAGEFGAAANTDDTHSDISDVDPSVATLAAAGAEFRASISRGRRGLESSHGRPSTGSGWSAGGFGDGARHPAAAHMHSELFATTVSLQNSAISLPSSAGRCCAAACAVCPVRPAGCFTWVLHNTGCDIPPTCDLMRSCFNCTW